MFAWATSCNHNKMSEVNMNLAFLLVGIAFGLDSFNRSSRSPGEPT
ncbi:hypothetical protein [Azospirillum argentinense]